MTNRKRCISNSIRPMNRKRDMVVAYDMGPTLKNYITLSKKFFSFKNLLPTQNLTVNLT